MKTSFRIRKTQGRRSTEISANGIMGWLSINDKNDEIESGNLVFENGEIQLVFSKFEAISETTANQVFAAIANELAQTRIVEHPDGSEYSYYDTHGMAGAARAAEQVLK